MNSLKKQQGSVQIVVVTVLILAILGALGFAFWQNNSSQDNQENLVISYISKVEDGQYKGWNMYRSERDGYTINYPQDWTATQEREDDGPYISGSDENIVVRVIVDKNDDNFKARTGLTTTDWYEKLGTSDIKKGPALYESKYVKDIIVSGLSSKSTKSVFTSTDESIYFLRGDKLYNIDLYPYGISSDSDVKLMLDSFKFI